MWQKLKIIDSSISDIIESYDCEDVSSNLNFNKLALDVFRFQYDYNNFYRNFCQNLGINKSKVEHYSQIPIISTLSYKDGSIVSTLPKTIGGIEYVTSGTTNVIKGIIYRDPNFFILREKAILAAGKNELFFRFYPDKIRIIFLDYPNRRNLNNYPLNYSVLYNFQRFFGNNNSICININFKDEMNNFIKIIRQHQQTKEPLVIMGPSYNISFALDFFKRVDITDAYLPPKSIIMDSGGLKKQGYHTKYSEYVYDLLECFHISRNDYINTYALSEVGSQFSDNIRIFSENIWKQCPPWAKIRIINMENEKQLECKTNEIGEVIIYDLLNRGSIFAIRTYDYAIKREKGFTIIERELLT